MHSSWKIHLGVAALGWLTVMLLRSVLLEAGDIRLLSLFAGLAVAVTLHSCFFFYVLMDCLDARTSRHQLSLYPGVFRVKELPTNDSSTFCAKGARICVGDYGWQAEAPDTSELIYLQGLNEDWHVVWYAGFASNQLEYICDKPENQLDRRAWQNDQKKCPFVVSVKIPNIDTYGMPRTFEWILGGYVPEHKLKR